VPQRPYLPLGPLTNALLYPNLDGKSFPAGRLQQVLREVGLDGLVEELDVVENWGQRLSLGEQQRLGFARVLLAKPALLFLDESASGSGELWEGPALQSAPFRVVATHRDQCGPQKHINQTS
jgi:vitamin B12/bleomycin/antimicrobial peptide transport system ATP-binding/permease protein